MATGSGKTLIMAGCIIYLYKQGYRKFLFFSTSNPIIEKTKGNFLDLFSNKYLFNQKINIDGKNIEIKQIDVFDEADEDNINIKFTTIHKLHIDLGKDAENSLNFNDLKTQKIVLIADECHHFNKKTKENKNKENKQLEFAEILKNEKNWEATIEKILNSNNENILLEYTATIDWNNENIRNKYLSKCLIKYDLKEFRENGYSKEIKLFQSDAGIEKENLILQAIIINQYKQDIATDHNLNIKPKSFYIIIFVVLFATVKFHFRFNIDRKFHDLENIDKEQAIKANNINKNFKNLRWISKFDDPKNELLVIKKAIEKINNDNREKTLITHYQFMSTILDKPLNILNRWYLWDNNTHPTENHKYFEFYKSLVNRNMKENKIKIIYLLGQENEIKFDNVKNYFTDTCFESKTFIPNRFSAHKLVNCKK